MGMVPNGWAATLPPNAATQSGAERAGVNRPDNRLSSCGLAATGLREPARNPGWQPSACFS